MTIAGFLGGVIAPSRDMLVRNAAPPGAAGRAFGIVSTGFNFSGILSPLLFGWIMDQNLPHWVFGASVVFMVLTVLLALVTDRKPQARADRTRRRGGCIPEPHRRRLTAPGTSDDAANKHKTGMEAMTRPSDLVIRGGTHRRRQGRRSL